MCLSQTKPEMERVYTWKVASKAIGHSSHYSYNKKNIASIIYLDIDNFVVHHFIKYKFKLQETWIFVIELNFDNFYWFD
jgi:hypothetical protein